MFGTVLEVAIGLIFVYLLLSLICSGVNEWIATLLKRRAVFLEEGIRNLLSDAATGGVTDELYAHPLIKSLGRTSGLQARGWKLFKPQGDLKPSAIPAASFARALLDLTLPEALDGGLPDRPDAIVEKAKAIETALPGWSADVKKTLALFLKESRGNIEKLTQSIEGWFNNSMERVSGWYKRRTQLVLFVIGFLLAALLNVDTLVMANGLWRNSELRAFIVAEAQTEAGQPSGQPTDPAEVAEQVDRLDSLQLPIGWSSDEGDPRDIPRNAGEFLVKLFGILITAAALSLGAPFWFDALQRSIAMRGPRQSTLAEAQKQ